MADYSKESIRIGTLIRHAKIDEYKGLGFESFNIRVMPSDLGKLPEIARAVTDSLADTGITVSALEFFGNLFDKGAEGETSLAVWREMIDCAHLFGCDIAAGFTGILRGASDEENMCRYREIFGELGKRAADSSVRIAFEICGKAHAANLAINPLWWNRLFDALPFDHIGLQWEPAHQIRQLIDPVAQLREWVGKVFHVHGKDAQVRWDILKKHGTLGGENYVIDRTPGFGGETDWTEVITILRLGGFHGSIDIEGFHDPVYKGTLEKTAQVHALKYLIHARGGYFIE